MSVHGFYDVPSGVLVFSGFDLARVVAGGQPLLAHGERVRATVG